MIPTVRLNGTVFTRKSTAIRLNGVSRITAVDSLEWSDEVPAELVSAMNDGGVPLGKAIGNYGCAASIGIYLDASAAFEAELMLTNPLAAGNLSAVTFQLSIIAREDVRSCNVVLVNCNIKGRANSVGNDGSALVKTYTLQPTMVLENGIGLVNIIPAI
jgi:hypothetical protein